MVKPDRTATPPVAPAAKHEPAPSGRPSAALPEVFAGIDLGGTNVKLVIVGSTGQVLAQQAQATDADRGPDAVVNDIAAVVEAALAQSGLTRKHLQAVGVGTPGPLDLHAGRIVRAANLPGWENVPLRSLFESRLGVRAVLDNDGNTAAYGEFWLGAGGNRRDLVMLTLGTGVGAGVVIDRRLLHGHFGNAAELGHMIVSVDGLPCPCGQRGCLEQYASAAAVGRRAVAEGGPADAALVAQGAMAGDAVCRRVWEDACRYLAIACITIQHAYNPEVVVFGGGMSTAGEFLLAGVRAHLARQRWSLHDDLPELVLSELGTYAGAIGAAGLALRSS
ncbi:MAG: ROK family protein [Planctomycetes bacterium]|nr:ROK family protein [Planctomycetota bacterium]